MGEPDFRELAEVIADLVEAAAAADIGDAAAHRRVAVLCARFPIHS